MRTQRDSIEAGQRIMSAAEINSASVTARAPRKANPSRKPTPASAATHPSAISMFVSKAIHAAHERLLHTTSTAEFQFLKCELDRLHSSGGRPPKSLSSGLQAWAISYFRKSGALPDQPAADISAPRHTKTGCARRSRRKASSRKGGAAQSGGLARGKIVPGVGGSSPDSKSLRPARDHKTGAGQS